MLKSAIVSKQQQQRPRSNSLNDALEKRQSISELVDRGLITPSAELTPIVVDMDNPTRSAVQGGAATRAAQDVGGGDEAGHRHVPTP